MTPSEDVLLALLKVDVTTYLDLLVLEYQDRLLFVVLCIVKNLQDAEEIVQDTFVKAHQALLSFSPEQWDTLRLRAWLTKIATNQALNALRSRNSHARPISIDSPEALGYLDEHEPYHNFSPESILEQQETFSELRDQIYELPDLWRIPFILHYLGGLPYAEIAAILHQSINTAKSNGRRGRQRLIEMQQRYPLLSEESEPSRVIEEEVK